MQFVNNARNKSVASKKDAGVRIAFSDRFSTGGWLLFNALPDLTALCAPAEMIDRLQFGELRTDGFLSILLKRSIEAYISPDPQFSLAFPIAVVNLTGTVSVSWLLLILSLLWLRGRCAINDWTQAGRAADRSACVVIKPTGDIDARKN